MTSVRLRKNEEKIIIILENFRMGLYNGKVKLTPLLLLVVTVNGIYHCGEHLSLEAQQKTKAVLTNPNIKTFTGFMDEDDPRGLRPLQFQRPPPCGSYSHGVEDLERFRKTAVQIYRHDPTIPPHTVVTISAVRVITSCVAHWIGRNVLSVKDETVSKFSRLPQDALEVFLYQLKSRLPTYKLGADLLEVLDQDIYACPWFSNPGEKTSYLLRIQSKAAYWSPTGFLISPYFLKDCQMNNKNRSCNVSEHTRVMWDNPAEISVPLVPGSIMGGILEISSRTTTNRICPGVTRFINLKNTFQLSFSVPDIRDWAPETVVRGVPIYLSDEGIFFSFLNHDGDSILHDICPSWSNDRRRRSSGAHTRQREFSSSLPLDLQTSTLEEEVSWIRAETEGQLGGLYNRTVRELVDLHFQDCQLKKLVTEISIGLAPLDPRPYISVQLGHNMFKVQQIGNKKYYRVVNPVSNLTWNLNKVHGQNFPVNFTYRGEAKSGYFICSRGYISLSPVMSNDPTKECFLYLHVLGGIDLCTGLTTPSVSEDLANSGQWIPKISVPEFRMADVSYKNHLEEEWFYSTDTNSLLQSMGHSLLHDNPNYFSLSAYTQLIDRVVFWTPLIIGLYVTIKLLSCCCSDPTSQSLRSRVM